MENVNDIAVLVNGLDIPFSYVSQNEYQNKCTKIFNDTEYEKAIRYIKQYSKMKTKEIYSVYFLATGITGCDYFIGVEIGDVFLPR